MKTKKKTYSLEHPCAKCGFKKGLHLANTLHCPFSGKQFTSFHTDQTFEPRPGWVSKQRFTI